MILRGVRQLRGGDGEDLNGAPAGVGAHLEQRGQVGKGFLLLCSSVKKGPRIKKGYTESRRGGRGRSARSRPGRPTKPKTRGDVQMPNRPAQAAGRGEEQRKKIVTCLE